MASSGVKLSSDDFRRRKELDEARKAGLAPAEVRVVCFALSLRVWDVCLQDPLFAPPCACSLAPPPLSRARTLTRRRRAHTQPKKNTS